MTTPDDKLSSREESKSLYFAMSEVAFGGTATGCKSTGTGERQWDNESTSADQCVMVKISTDRSVKMKSTHSRSVSKIDVIIVGRGSFLNIFFCF